MAISKGGTERLVKKYPNRRLYNTQTNTHITLADVKQLTMETEESCVVDAKFGEDLTCSTLLQIILEEETGGVPILSDAVFTRIVRSYGNAAQGIMDTYLEENIQAFVDIQSKLAENSKDLYGDSTFNPGIWSQPMDIQGPMMQGMVGNHIEQNKNLPVQIQEQMQGQAENISGTFPFNQPSEKR